MHPMFFIVGVSRKYIFLMVLCIWCHRRCRQSEERRRHCCMGERQWRDLPPIAGMGQNCATSMCSKFVFIRYESIIRMIKSQWQILTRPAFCENTCWKGIRLFLFIIYGWRTSLEVYLDELCLPVLCVQLTRPLTHILNLSALQGVPPPWIYLDEEGQLKIPHWMIRKTENLPPPHMHATTYTSSESLRNKQRNGTHEIRFIPFPTSRWFKI